MRLLFVCTGNLCRSPVAERLTLTEARHVLGLEVPQVQVGSAGLAAIPDRKMHPLSAAALTELGGSPDGFRSRAFDPGMATDADLVLTMTRAQRRGVLERTPRGLRRTFTLLEAANLCTRADLTGLDSVPLPDRARALAPRLDTARRCRASTPADDITDPIGGRASVHRAAAAAIAEALRPLTAVLFAPAPAPGTSPMPDDAVCS